VSASTGRQRDRLPNSSRKAAKSPRQETLCGFATLRRPKVTRRESIIDQRSHTALSKEPFLYQVDIACEKQGHAHAVKLGLARSAGLN
jgi:hypothetical protein